MRLAALFLALFVFGCNSSPTDPGGNGTITLPFGQTALAGPTRISFTDVVEDSRCPADVVCVWQGDAAIEVSSGSSKVVLHTGLADRREARLGDVTVRLESVKPERSSQQTPNKSDYVITLQVSR